MSFERHPVNRLHAEGAPAFVTLEAGRLLDLAKARFEAETGRTLSPSQVEMYLLETVAYMLAIRGGEEQLAFENCFIAYARSAWLDRHGADRDTPRLQAVPATTTLRFETAAPAVARIPVPASTRVGDAAGQVQFRTLETVHIEVGQSGVEVKAEATAPGVFANGYPIGALSALVDAVPGLSAVTNLTETGGGAGIEDDTRYRARLALAFERIGAGLSRERYVTDTLAWNARCVDVAVERPQPGHVHLHPLMDTGAPNTEEVAALLAVFDESNIHQGDFIQVMSPQPHAFTFQLALTLSDPLAEAAAEAEAQAVLDGWARTLGGHIAPSEIIRAARSVPGVIEAATPDLALTPVAATAWRACTGFTTTVALA